MNLNKTFLVLIMLSFLFLFTCRDSDDGGKNGGGAGMFDYICPNGTPKDGKSQTPNDNKCKACDAGYTLVNEQCMGQTTYPYVCTNGTPKDGSSLTENDNQCQSCNEGYSLENMSCTIPASPAGMGTEASPYVLLNYAHLKTMALNKHYKLGADIDARDSWNEGAMGCSAYAGDVTLPTGTPCTGWVPVGGGSDETDATRFTGSLDGNGHTIMNLYTYVKATSGATYTGLFGVTGGSAEIKNLGLKGIYVNVSNTSTTESYVGGLVGLVISGTIVNSYAAGEINVSTRSNGFLGGGLVGNNAGTIINSYAAAKVSVSSFDPISGGLVGQNTGGTIVNSYATGEVTAICPSLSLGTIGGGLVGLNKSTAGSIIKSSYATGNVSLSCPSSVITDFSGGGLVGQNRKTIENSYAAGRAACIAGETCNNPQFGGLAGENRITSTISSTISGTNYFVFNAADDTDGNGVGRGSCVMGATCARKTLAQLKALNEGDSTGLGWNTTVWDVSTTTFAKLKYVAGFCSDPAHTTEAACTTASATWRAVAACETIASNDKAVNQGAQLPDCGDLIAGQ